MFNKFEDKSNRLANVEQELLELLIGWGMGREYLYKFFDGPYVSRVTLWTRIIQENELSSLCAMILCVRALCEKYKLGFNYTINPSEDRTGASARLVIGADDRESER